MDRIPNLDEYLFDLCKKKGWQKTVFYQDFQIILVLKTKKTLLKAFVESQFGYCPLTWAIHNRKANSKTNHIRERDLKIVCKNNVLSFEELLELNKLFKIHHRKIQSLAIDPFKGPLMQIWKSPYMFVYI